MDSILCGSCMFKKYPNTYNGTLVDATNKYIRLNYAKTLEDLSIYRCSACRVYFYFDGFRWVKTHDFGLVQSYLDQDLKKRGVLSYVL